MKFQTQFSWKSKKKNNCRLLNLLSVLRLRNFRNTENRITNNALMHLRRPEIHAQGLRLS